MENRWLGRGLYEEGCRLEKVFLLDQGMVSVVGWEYMGKKRRNKAWIILPCDFAY